MVTRHFSTEQLVPAVATVLVIGVLTISAWSLVATSGGTADHPQIDADVQQRYESIDGVNATQTTVISRNGTVASRTTYHATLQPGTERKRLVPINSTAQASNVRISDGSTLWLYNGRRESATRVPLPETESDRGERLQRLFTKLDESKTDPQSVEPLPVVPQSERRPVNSTEEMTVRYRGTEPVDGREAYVVHVTPRNETKAYEQTVWVETQRFFPTKKRTAWTANGKHTVVTTRYANISYDTDVSSDAFSPDFPDDTTVSDPEPADRRFYLRCQLCAT
ncbi:LolA family protein [Haloarcula sp. NS06]|uniref:LolA family protein n=1 Tax=unclassified Haloarcula TaxID=2624677 RepID=UPI0027B0652C|nr:outer membrane lipoprotein carrier protein LolA [Haloarcula sp. H-GB4]MDQ2073706.1 outer membrane lipoprotein carrier protein LolA [Haloarcula sp. H-GB4]